jgi:hypothetical protein
MNTIDLNADPHRRMYQRQEPTSCGPRTAISLAAVLIVLFTLATGTLVFAFHVSHPGTLCVVIQH